MSKKSDFLETWNALSAEEQAAMKPDLKGWEAKWADEPSEPETLREDGPTLEEYVAKGYKAENYPPQGYAARTTPYVPAPAPDREGLLLVETTGDFMLVDSTHHQEMQAERPSVVRRTPFVNMEIDRKRLRVLKEHVNFTDAELAEDPSLAK